MIMFGVRSGLLDPRHMLQSFFPTLRFGWCIFCCHWRAPASFKKCEHLFGSQSTGHRATAGYHFAKNRVLVSGSAGACRATEFSTEFLRGTLELRYGNHPLIGLQRSIIPSLFWFPTMVANLVRSEGSVQLR